MENYISIIGSKSITWSETFNTILLTQNVSANIDYNCSVFENHYTEKQEK